MNKIECESINKAIEELKKYRKKHIELGKALHKAYGGAIYIFDLLVVATLNRSICLLKGFVMLIQDKNFLAAAPLLRLQLDNCLRLSAGTLVNNPHDFALKVLEGLEINKQEDRSKKKMTDKYLVTELSQRYPWVKNLYTNTSGYVHLSEKAIIHAWQSSAKENIITSKITDEDEYITDELYLESIEAFKAITDILFEYVESWIYTKENPEEAERELRNRT